MKLVHCLGPKTLEISEARIKQRSERALRSICGPLPIIISMCDSAAREWQSINFPINFLSPLVICHPPRMFSSLDFFLERLPAKSFFLRTSKDFLLRSSYQEAQTGTSCRENFSTPSSWLLSLLVRLLIRSKEEDTREDRSAGRRS